MKNGKITSIEPKGPWNNGEQTFQRYQVCFDNGDNPVFLAIGEFKKNVGDVVQYKIKDAKYNTAKLVYTPPTKSGVSNNKDQIIIRQTCVKASAEFNASRLNSDINKVIADAQLLIDFINNG